MEERDGREKERVEGVRERDGEERERETEGERERERGRGERWRADPHSLHDLDYTVA